MQTADAEPRGRAAEVIEQLLREGQPVETGRFTLDPVAAATKLQAFRYLDRNVYPVPLLEAMFGLGAERVEIQTRGPDLEVLAWPVALPEPERLLYELFAYALGTPEDAPGRALARLAVAIDMMLGLDQVERVAVSLLRDRTQTNAEYRIGRAPTVVVREQPSELTPARTGHARPGELRVLVDRPAWAALTNPNRAALTVLHEAVRFSARVVVVDGEQVSGRPRTLDRVHRRRGPGLPGWAGLGDGAEPSAVELWVGDLCVERIPAPGRGFYAVIGLQDPRWDLSQVTVVRDGALAEALAWAEQTRERMIAELEDQAQGWALEDQWPTGWPRARVDALLQPVGGVLQRGADVRTRVGRGLASAMLYAIGVALMTLEVGPLAVSRGDGPLLFVLAGVGLVLTGAIQLSWALVDGSYRDRLLQPGWRTTFPVSAGLFVLGLALAYALQRPAVEWDASRVEPPPARFAAYPLGFVRVPGGRVEGHDVATFELMRTEVRVADYRACVDAGVCRAPDDGASAPEQAWFYNWGKPDRDLHPVNGVSWDDAQTFCRWAGARLPTEWEWERAARGRQRDGRGYPWGRWPEPNLDVVNACGSECVDAIAQRVGLEWRRAYVGDDGWPGTAPVGSKPRGASSDGLQDLAGNVWEWTDSWYDGDQRVLRGGSWGSSHTGALQNSYRLNDTPSSRYDVYGFRCARAAT